MVDVEAALIGISIGIASGLRGTSRVMSGWCVNAAKFKSGWFTADQRSNA
ncbi:MAG: hypothetical protein RL018_648, partial [Pseudomonadota bacterium]